MCNKHFLKKYSSPQTEHTQVTSIRICIRIHIQKQHYQHYISSIHAPFSSLLLFSKGNHQPGYCQTVRLALLVSAPHKSGIIQHVLLCLASGPVINISPLKSKFTLQYLLCDNALDPQSVSFTGSMMLNLVSRGHWRNTTRGREHVFQALELSIIFPLFLLLLRGHQQQYVGTCGGVLCPSCMSKALDCFLIPKDDLETLTCQARSGLTYTS